MTAGRRSRLTEADHAAWDGFIRHIVPLAGRAGTGVGVQSGRPDTPPPSASQPGAPQPGATPAPGPRPTPRRVYVEARSNAAATPLAIGGPPAGVDKATWQRFRTGKLAALRTLDLHGMTAQRAFQALTSFLRTAHAEHVRCVEIVTGRGAGEARGDGRGEGRGVLRREFPLWLNRPDIRPLVLGAAHPHAANTGSVRLLLRRVR
jgi:DNA-nicking Smr family endonuclease